MADLWTPPEPDMSDRRRDVRHVMRFVLLMACIALVMFGSNDVKCIGAALIGYLIGSSGAMEE